MMGDFQDVIAIWQSVEKFQPNSVSNYGTNSDDLIFFITGGEGWPLVVLFVIGIWPI